MKKKLTSLLAAGALIFVSSCGYDQGTEVSDETIGQEDDMGVNETDPDLETTDDQGMFAEWDADDDSYISEDEYNTGFDDGTFDNWETEGDEVIDEDDWGTTLYTTADTDDNNEWDENEWNEFTTNWDDNEWGTFDDWDLNDDNILDENEWNEGFANSGWFDDWDVDGDGELTTDEYNSYTYQAYDEDDDNMWSEEEYDAYEQDWGV